MNLGKKILKIMLSSGLLLTSCFISVQAEETPGEIIIEDTNIGEDSNTIEDDEIDITDSEETDQNDLENIEITIDLELDLEADYPLPEPAYKNDENISFYSSNSRSTKTNLTYKGIYGYDYSWKVLDIVNAKRKALGLSTLTMDTELHKAAMQRAAELCAYFSHTRPDGSDFSTVCNKAWGENIAMGPFSPEAVMYIWQNSPGHWQNITRENWNSIGIGCFTQGRDIHYVQLFSGYQAEKSTLKSNKNANATISILAKNVSLDFDLDFPIITKGETVQINPVCKNAEAEGSYAALNPSDFSWTAGNSIISVSPTGKVKGQKTGRAALSAHLKENSAFKIKNYINVSANSSDPIQVENLSAVPDGKNRVKLSWDPFYQFDGFGFATAESYLVYASKNGVRKYCGMVTNTNYDGNRVEFVDKNALDSTYNFYWVYPRMYGFYGKLNVGTCKKYVYAKGILPSASNFSAKSTTRGVVLNWNKVSGADGYLIYGKKNGKPYGYIGMTGKTTFTDSTAASNQYSFYWVIPYHKDSKGKLVPGKVSVNYVFGKKSL